MRDQCLFHFTVAYSSPFTLIEFNSEFSIFCLVPGKILRKATSRQKVKFQDYYSYF